MARSVMKWYLRALAENEKAATCRLALPPAWRGRMAAASRPINSAMEYHRTTYDVSRRQAYNGRRQDGKGKIPASLDVPPRRRDR